MIGKMPGNGPALSTGLEQAVRTWFIRMWIPVPGLISMEDSLCWDVPGGVNPPVLIDALHEYHP